jgi:DNA-binding IclR family transcriptional regulator
MEDRIGELAGDVWDHLQEKGEQSVSAVSRALDAPQTKVNMALGWLAREGKLEFNAEGRGTLIQNRD